MKKATALALTLGFVVSAVAQNVSFGPIAGFNSVWYTNMPNRQFKPSFNAGVTLTYSSKSHFGVSAEPRISFNEGFKTSTAAGQFSEKTELDATYLRMPVKLSYFFGQWGDMVRPKLYVGPSVGVLLKGKQEYTLTNGTHTFTTEKKAEEVLNKFDFGVVAGAGIHVRLLQNTWAHLDASYYNGLLDATKEGAWNGSRSLGVNLGVTFPLGTYKD